MKLTINVDCTPQEARDFFGLPDVSGVNKSITDSLEKQMETHLESLTDPQKYFETVMSQSSAGMELMRSAMMGMMAGGTTKKK
ncbi:MAG: DUF6489 family protein [bacterium]